MDVIREPQKVKMYGGPAHGKIEYTNSNRLCVVEPRPFYHYRNPFAEITQPTTETSTYYVKQYGIRAFTMAGAEVHKEKLVALWEGNKLLPHEKRELLYDMERLPWKWFEKP